MPAPTPSRLDHQQCIQGSFDESTGRLRVDAVLTAEILPPPGLEVSILSSFDNIAIRNTSNSNELLINTDGSINVKIETSAIEIGKVDQGNAGVQAWLVDGSGVIQPVSNSNLISIDSKLPSGLTVSATRLLVDGSGVTQPISGTVTANISTSSSATCTNVASSATNVTLLASNANRKLATFYNDSTAIAYLKFGATASSTSYTIQMAAGSYFELPVPGYTGQIDAIWASANGNMRVTEY